MRSWRTWDNQQWTAYTIVGVILIIAAIIAYALAVPSSPTTRTAAHTFNAPGAAPTRAPAPGTSPSQAPDGPAGLNNGCTLDETEDGAQLVFTGESSSCSALAQQLAQQAGGYWQIGNVNITLSLTCAMSQGPAVVYVFEDPDGFMGTQLCQDFQASGWTEDTAAEQTVTGAQASASAAAAQASQASENESDAAYDVTVLQGDATSLTNEGTTFGNTLADTNKDLTTTQQAANQGQGSYCVGVSQTGADADAVGADVAAVGADDEQAEYDIQGVRHDISVTQQLDTWLAGGGYTIPPGTNAAISAAQQAITTLINTGNSAISTVEGDAQQAYQTADGMATGACASSGVPGSPPAAPANLS